MRVSSDLMTKRIMIYNDVDVDDCNGNDKE